MKIQDYKSKGKTYIIAEIGQAHDGSLGILHSLIGSIPNKYSCALSTIGMEGNVNQGMNEMQSLIDSAKKTQNMLL